MQDAVAWERNAVWRDEESAGGEGRGAPAQVARPPSRPLNCTGVVNAPLNYYAVRVCRRSPLHHRLSSAHHR